MKILHVVGVRPNFMKVAAIMAEMTRWDFHDLLGEEGIPRRYDVEELEEDLQTLEELG